MVSRASFARTLTRNLSRSSGLLGPARPSAFRPWVRVFPQHGRRFAHTTLDHNGMQVVYDESPASLGLPDNFPARLEKLSLFLRDSCRCAACVDRSSGQKTFATTDIPADIRPRHVRVRSGFNLEIQWENDVPSAPEGHVTSVSNGAMYRQHLGYSGQNQRLRWRIPDRQVPAVGWDAGRLLEEATRITYDDWMGMSADGDADLWKGLMALEAFGLVFIRNVPQDVKSVARITQRIANLQETFYGRTWDVVSKPAAENVAYTNAYLGLHQDILYLKQVPRIQVLHCLENSCEGGESLYSDGFQAAVDEFEFGEPDFHLMLNKSIRYHYDKSPHLYRNAHPVFLLSRPFRSVDFQRERFDISYMQAVRWSPPFQAINAPSPEDLTPPEVGGGEGGGDGGGGEAPNEHTDLVAAMRRYARALERPGAVLEFKMAPGECVVFDNYRVLHGRRGFDPTTGTRHLRGAYVSNEDFCSKMAACPRQGVMEPYVRDLARRFNAQPSSWKLQPGVSMTVRQWLTNRYEKQAVRGQFEASIRKEERGRARYTRFEYDMKKNKYGKSLEFSGSDSSL